MGVDKRKGCSVETDEESGTPGVHRTRAFTELRRVLRKEKVMVTLERLIFEYILPLASH